MSDGKKHDQLASDVKDNSQKLFGEQICWIDPPPKLKALTHRKPPDLVGKASNGNIIIVEVKTEFDNADKTNKLDGMDKSVGQVLRYAYAYIEELICQDQKPSDEKLKEELKKFRLFIVGREHLQRLEDICQLLQAHCINIRHFNLNTQLE